MLGITLLNRYKIETELGKGGLGIVYQAHDILLDRAVAIKVLNASGIEASSKERLLYEARAVAKLNHPHIVSVFDAGESADNPFIVMELVNGKTLRQYQIPNLLESINFINQICKALEHAHSKGIIHRDLKPENIIVTDSKTAKLMDFGLAYTADQQRLTQEGMVIGTLAYIAPELIEGGKASQQSDLYGLGIVFYEMITGKLPFNGTISEVISQHLFAKVKPPSEINPSIPAWIDSLVIRLLSKHPEERPVSVSEVISILEKQVESPQVTFQYQVESKTRNNLPSQLTSFIGREKEIEQIQNLISTNRLLTLTGVGGTGKTRLALQVANQLLDNFRDGIWFVELAPITSPELIGQTVIQSLQLHELGERSTYESIADFLKERTSLLILDNCEHLIQKCAEFSNRLLQDCAQLKIITTSREPLSIVGEVIWSVPSLSVPPHETELTEELLDSYESIKLFIERAQAVQPTFEANKNNLKTIAQICTRLDGIPLALELAAARMRSMNIEQIASRLDDRFRLLTGGSRTSLPRQQTLNALVDWSYNLLSDSEKLLFQRLAIFIGLFTLEAAEKICSASGIDEANVFDTLQRLVDKSLVITEERDQAIYYRLLETIRQYGQEKLFASAEAENLIKQHNEYFFALTSSADKELRGPNQIKWSDHLTAMFDNIRVVLERTIEFNNTETALQLALNLEWFWFMLGKQREAIGWFQKVLNMPNVDAYPELLSTVLSQMAHHIWIQLGEIESKPFVSKALTIARTHKLKWCTAKALSVFGVLLATERNFKESHIALNESNKLFGELGDKWNFARTYMGFGLAFHHEGNQVDSLRMFKKALPLFRELGDRYFTASGLRWVGHEMVLQGEVQQGLELLNESLILACELKSTYEIHATIWSAAMIAQHLNKPARAVRLFLATKKIAESIGAWREKDDARLKEFLKNCEVKLDENEFQLAFDQGNAISLEQVIAYALEK